jgi:hypothetical protein
MPALKLIAEGFATVKIAEKPNGSIETAEIVRHAIRMDLISVVDD